MDTSTKKLLNCWGYGNTVYAVSDTGGKRRTEKITYPWYFIIKTDDYDQAKNLIPYPHRTQNGFPGFTKVFYCGDDKDYTIRYNAVLDLEKNGIKTYEGDLLTDRRWYIDKTPEIAINHTKLYFDIETDDTDLKIEIGAKRILSFSAIDDKGKIYFEILETDSDRSEKKLINSVIGIIQKYDMILGWNNKEFDIPYIRSRAEKQGLGKEFGLTIKRVASFDLLKRFRHIFRFDSSLRKFSLDFIADHFLGRGKIKHTEKIIDLWTNDKEKLKEYNIEDSILVKELDDKLKVSEMMIRQASWCGVPTSQFGLYSIIDAFILKTAHDHQTYGPTSLPAIKERNKKNERLTEDPDGTTTKKNKYLGAEVLMPDIGLYDNVYCFDFKSLYPSMIRTSNIGYDSIRYEMADNCLINPGTSNIPRGSGFIKPTYFDKQKSIIAIAIEYLLTKRKEYKNQKLQMIEDGTNHGPEWESVVSDEIIVKELSNSTYGIMGLQYGRYYNIDVAESITLMGQWTIRFAKKFFDGLGHPVIYGDTDSIFVSTGQDLLDIEHILNLFHTALQSELQDTYKIDDCQMELEFDKHYDKYLLITKKTYVGHVINIEGKKTNDIYARGLDYHKKNIFGFAGKKQKELLDIILLKPFDLVFMNEWMENTKREFYATTFERDDLIITQRVGRATSTYKSKPLHVQLATDLEKETGGSLVKTEIEYIVTSYTKGMGGCLVGDYKGIYAKDYYWENKTLPLLTRVLSVIFPGHEFCKIQLTLF